MMRPATERLVDLIYSHQRRFQGEPDRIVQLFAAAGLMRCCLLLRAILTLEAATLGQVSGILARQHWETWLVSLYVLLKGEPGLLKIAGDDIHWKRKLASGLQLDLSYHKDWPHDIARLNYRDLYKELEALLAHAGDPNTTGLDPYATVYGTQSLFSLHANIATITAHIEYGPETWTIRPNPPIPFSDVLRATALHTSHLAGYVFRAFEVPRTDLDAIYAELLRPPEAT